jgi:Xaa-Pro dipeptidase
MDKEKIYKERLQRIRNEMGKTEADTLVLVKPQNIFYVSNFNAIIYSRPIIVTLGLDDEPSLIVPRMKTDHAKDESRVKDIRVYHKMRMSRAPATMASDPLTLLKEVLEERNATKGNIGIEKDYLTITMFDELRKVLPDANFIDITDSFRKLRMIKDAEEIEMIRRAAEIGIVGMENALNATSEGTTEIEVSIRGMNAMNEYWKEKYSESEVTDFGSVEEWIVNALWCLCLTKKGLYGIDSPSSRKLMRGDIPWVVCLATVNGYHCEIERSPILGQPTPEQKRVFEANLEAIERILETIRPGVTCSEVAEVGAKVYDKYGYAEYTHARAGHAMGLGAHEELSFALGEQTVLEKGMVMSVEPSINVRGMKVNHSNVGVVTEDGFDLLTEYRLNELIVL